MHTVFRLNIFTYVGFAVVQYWWVVCDHFELLTVAFLMHLPMLTVLLEDIMNRKHN